MSEIKVKREIEIVKTPWYKMIKVKRRCKKWNKKYDNRPMTIEETMEAMLDL